MIRLGLMMLFLLAVLGATLWIYFNTGLPEPTAPEPAEHGLLHPAWPSRATAPSNNTAA